MPATIASPCRDHYEICPTCGQAINLRELGDVLHHETSGRKPFPTQ
jgi:hypothetical protein